jgi:DNA-binding response OmpR family regulator
MEPPKPKPRRTALCVVAENQFRSLVGRVLRNAGFVVIEAATCAAAKQLVQNSSPDFVVLDVNLPDGNGFELATVWRVGN